MFYVGHRWLKLCQSCCFVGTTEGNLTVTRFLLPRLRAAGNIRQRLPRPSDVGDGLRWINGSVKRCKNCQNNVARCLILARGFTPTVGVFLSSDGEGAAVEEVVRSNPWWRPGGAPGSTSPQTDFFIVTPWSRKSFKTRFDIKPASGSHERILSDWIRFTCGPTSIFPADQTAWPDWWRLFLFWVFDPRRFYIC